MKNKKQKKRLFAPITFSQKRQANENIRNLIKEVKQGIPQEYSHLKKITLSDPKELSFLH